MSQVEALYCQMSFKIVHKRFETCSALSIVQKHVFKKDTQGHSKNEILKTVAWK